MGLFVKGKLIYKAGEGSGGGGGGGSDEHNLGWYATESALTTAHPTANDGDFAIVGATDTVWVWDSDTSAWVDTATTGLVTSVNGRTGAVTVLDNTAVSGTSLTLLGGASTYAYAVNIGQKSNETQDSSMVGVVALGYETESKGNGAIAIGGTASATYGGAKTNGTGAIAIGANTGSGLAGAKAVANEAIAVGAMTEASGVNSIGIGGQAQVSGKGSIAIGEKAKVTGENSALISGAESYTYTLADNDSLAFANTNGGFVLLDQNGEVPSDRLVKAINKYSVMPTADATNRAWIVQYTGATDSTYTHGYIYENIEGGGYEGTVSFTAATISGTTAACSGDDFAALVAEYISTPNDIVSGTLTYAADGDVWAFVGKDSQDATVGNFQLYTQDYIDAGFTFTGTPADGDVIAFTCTISGGFTYTWTQTNVQPVPSGLPSQTGNSGKFLTTDGTDASWTTPTTITFRTWGGNE